jgi:hypothetical protein
VAAGPVTAIYGDGGGVDLLAAGAVPSGLLRPSQAACCSPPCSGCTRTRARSGLRSPSTRAAFAASEAR